MRPPNYAILALLDEVSRLAVARIPTSPESPQAHRIEADLKAALASHFRALARSLPTASVLAAAMTERLELNTAPAIIRQRLDSRLRAILDSWLAGRSGDLQAALTQAWTRCITLVAHNPPVLREAVSAEDVVTLRSFEEFGASLGQKITRMNATTRKGVISAIVQGMGAGEGIPVLGKQIQTALTSMSVYRAELIATTETCEALSVAAEQQAIAMQATSKEWVTSGNENMCSLCSGNAAAAAIDIKAAFPSGHTRPPAHPDCRCTVIYGEVTPAPAKGEVRAGVPERKFAKAVPSSRPVGPMDIEDIDMDAQQKFLLEGLPEDVIKRRELVSSRLAEKTGLSPATCSRILKAWAESSNGENETSLLLQNAAARKFGLKLPTWQQDRIARVDQILADRMKSLNGRVRNAVRIRQEMGKSIAPEAIKQALLPEDYAFHKEVWTLTGNPKCPWKVTIALSDEFKAAGYKSLDDALDSVLSAMYEDTQARLKSMGIEQMTLWRGMTSTEAIPIGTVRSVDANALSSWTAQPKTAVVVFAKGDGYILEQTIPAERIFSVNGSGFGCVDEWECVVLGTPTGQEYVQIEARGARMIALQNLFTVHTRGKNLAWMEP